MKHHTWTPHEITSIETPRTGFIGRAAAMLIDGIECVVLCRNEVDLGAVGTLLCTQGFDIETIYRATLIQSVGVEVLLPAEVPESVPVRPDDGQPVATYKPVDPVEDHGDFPDAVTAVEDDDEL